MMFLGVQENMVLYPLVPLRASIGRYWLLLLVIMKTGFELDEISLFQNLAGPVLRYIKLMRTGKSLDVGVLK